MGNRRIIIIFAWIFTCVFALFYYFLFQMLANNEVSSRVLYLNQVGIYAKQANADQMCERLKEQDLTPYAVEKDDKIYVVTSIYETEDETEEEGEVLEEMGLNYLTKKITVEGTDMIEAVDEKDFVKVLQAIDDEATGD